MGEHSTNLENFQLRKREARQERELRDRWVAEDPGNHRFSAFEEFKGSDNWEGWSKREMQRMEEEVVSYRMRNDEVTRLRTLESLPEPPWPLQRLPKIPDFVLKDGSPAAVNRWELLRKDCVEETVRRSGELESVWAGVHEASIAELRADKKLTQQEFDALQEKMEAVWMDLKEWDKERRANVSPKLERLNATAAVKLGRLVSEHQLLFDKIDGAACPTAKYKLLSMTQAIAEMKARQIANRQPPPSYAKMLDRMNEIPGRLPVPKDVENTFNRSAYYLANPHQAWEELFGGAKAGLYDQAKAVSPEFFKRFKQMMGSEDPDDYRPVRNFQTISRNMKDSIEQWSKAKFEWPAREKTFKAAQEIAFGIDLMKSSLNEALAGETDAQRAIRERLHGVLDGLTDRISATLEQLK